jgi:hypothetical protein
MGYLINILVGAIGSLLAAEVWASKDRASQWLVQKAVDRLPVEEHVRRRDEWLSDLHDMPGAFQKLSWAVGCHWAVTVANARHWRLAAQERRSQKLRRQILAEIEREKVLDLHTDFVCVEVEFGSDEWLGIEQMAREIGCSVDSLLPALVHIGIRNDRKNLLKRYVRTKAALLGFMKFPFS